MGGDSVLPFFITIEYFNRKGFDLLIKYFVLALFVQACFVPFSVFLMFIRRLRAVNTGEVPATYFKTYQGLEKSAPRGMVLAERHYANLFQMPMLFLICGSIYLSTDMVDKMAVALAWTYVLIRLIHSIIHLGTNKIMHRLCFFAVSSVVLLVMWIYLIGKFFL